MAPIISAWHSLGPDAGCRDGSKPVPDSRGAPDRTVRPPREDHRRRRVQHDLPVPLDHQAGRRQAVLRRAGQDHIPPVRTPVPHRQPHRERHRAVVRIRREAQRAEGRDHRGAHSPQGEGQGGVRAGPGGRRHEESLLESAADLQDDAGDPRHFEGAPDADGGAGRPGPQRRGGPGRLHVSEGRCVRFGVAGFRFPAVRSSAAGEEPHHHRQEEDARQERLQDRSAGDRRFTADADRPRHNEGAAGGRVHHDRHRFQPRRSGDRTEEGSEAHPETRDAGEGHRSQRIRHPRLRGCQGDIPERSQI